MCVGGIEADSQAVKNISNDIIYTTICQDTPSTLSSGLTGVMYRWRMVVLHFNTGVIISTYTNFSEATVQQQQN